MGDLLRKKLSFLQGSWMHKFLHPADDEQVWDLVYGTSFGFSSIGIPGKSPALDQTIAALSESVDESIQSKSNMDVLAKYGVDMDHPCVRVYTKEEVDANRKFLVASGQHSALHRFIKVCLYDPYPRTSSLTSFRLTLRCRDCQRGRIT